MFSLADHIKNIDRKGEMYADGRRAFDEGASIADCPTYGTRWDQTSWLVGWQDALADRLRGRDVKINCEPHIAIDLPDLDLETRED